jgi:hypothetical protein
MNEVEIDSPEPFSIELIQDKLSKVLPVEEGASPYTIVVDNVQDRAYVYLDPEVGKYCLFVAYTDIELVKRIIEIIADAPDLIVDDGHDTVLPGDEFAARIKAQTGWDWRRDWRNSHPLVDHNGGP